MRTLRLLAAVMLMTICGCSTPKSSRDWTVEVNPGNGAPPEAADKASKSSLAAVLTTDAGDFLERLKKEDRLPGFRKDEHGEISTVIPVESLNRVSFPVFRTFHVTKNGERFFYHYKVTKVSQNSEWELQKAWQTDSAENFLKELK
jgi:hypothetical protein